MRTVFLLQHSYEIEGSEQIKIIGIYSTRDKAKTAIEKFKTLPGFSDYPDSFYIDEYEIDQDNWEEGFERII
jgi:hypothetical protein